MSTHIPTSIPMKLVVATSTTTTPTPNVNVNLSKLQKKGINIGEGGSSSIVVKNTSTVDPKYKGKSVRFEPSTEEKKRLQEIEMEKMRQLNSIFEAEER